MRLGSAVRSRVRDDYKLLNSNNPTLINAVPQCAAVVMRAYRIRASNRSLLQQEIKKNMKKYSQKFSVEDRMRESKASREQIERRRQLMSDYEEWAAELRGRFRQEKSERLELRNGGCDVYM